MSAISRQDTDRYKTLLEGRLKELGVRLEAIDDELTSHNSADWEELACAWTDC